MVDGSLDNSQRSYCYPIYPPVPNKRIDFTSVLRIYTEYPQVSAF